MTNALLKTGEKRGGRRPGAGRPKGSVGKAAIMAKQAIEEVFAILQDDDRYKLEVWAKANLTLFYTSLFPKLLPLQISGNSDQPLVIEMRRVIVDQRDVKERQTLIIDHDAD